MIKISQVLFLISKLFIVVIVRSQGERKVFNKIWHQVWLEEGYAKPNEPIVEKYSRYNSFAIDFLVKFLGILPVGTVRLIKNNDEVGLPVLKDFEVEKPWKDNQIMEVTLLTVLKRYRKFFHLPFLMLMRATYRYAKKHGAKGMVVAADKRLFYLLIRIGFPLIQIGQEKLYEGSTTYPAYISFEKAEEIMARKNPSLFRFFT